MLMSLAVILGSILVMIAVIATFLAIISFFAIVIKDILTGNTDSWGGGLFGPF